MLVNQMREVFTTTQKSYYADLRLTGNNHLKNMTERRQSAIKQNKLLFSQTTNVQSILKVSVNKSNIQPNLSTKTKLELLSKIVKNVGRKNKNINIDESIENKNYNQKEAGYNVNKFNLIRNKEFFTDIVDRSNSRERSLHYASISKRSKPAFNHKTASKRLFSIEEKSIKTPVTHVHSNSLSKNSIYKEISEMRVR